MPGDAEEFQEHDTDNVNVLDLILDEVHKIRGVQERYERELRDIQKRLGELAVDMRLVCAAQQEHGKKLGSLEHRCVRLQIGECARENGEAGGGS